MTDPLEGFRGQRSPSIERALAQIGEGDPSVHQRELLVNTLLGGAADRLLRQLATRDDAGLVLHGLVDRIELELREAMTTLLEQNDVGTQEARAAHFEARVCGGILRKLNDMVKGGVHAARELQEENGR